MPISLFQVFSPKEGDKLEVGKTYQIKWSPTAANIVSIYLDTGIVCVKAPCPSRVTIAENVPAQNRSYSWTISKDLGIYPKARIVVQYVSNSAMSGYFSIVSFLTQTYSSKYCVADSDCVLLTCAGPFNKEYAKTLPPDLPCTQYLDYQVSCIENKCTAVK